VQQTGDVMIRWLLNHFSVFELFILVVGGTTVLAIGLCATIDKLFPNLSETSFDKVAEGARVALGVFFFLTLALTINSASGRFAHGEDAVVAETNALALMTRSSDAFSPEGQAAVKKAISGYVHAVAEDEWDAMKNAKDSPRAAVALDDLYTAYQGYQPKPGIETSFYQSSLSKLDTVTSSRRERLQQAAASLPDIMRIFLVVGAILFIVFTYQSAIESRIPRTTLVAVAAAFVSFALLLTIVLDYPFAGEVSVSNYPYMQGALAQFWSDPPG
jgi:hypothetical protein